jgi:hypothetical protein
MRHFAIPMFMGVPMALANNCPEDAGPDPAIHLFVLAATYRFVVRSISMMDFTERAVSFASRGGATHLASATSNEHGRGRESSDGAAIRTRRKYHMLVSPADHCDLLVTAPMNSCRSLTCHSAAQSAKCIVPHIQVQIVSSD